MVGKVLKDGRSPASQGRAGALRAEPPEEAAQAKPLVPNAGAFTPGPWHVFKGHEINAANGCPVATVREYVPDSRSTSLANARLIAAAPDLYAELARAVVHLDAWARAHSDEATTETWAILHCARAALSKSTGA